MSAVRAGVVGTGHLGYHHARNYAALDGVTLAGVVDTDQERAAKASSDFNCPAFGTVAELIAAGVDAVSVVTPTTAHRDVALALIEAGVDVLVEKPIADSTAAGEAIVAAGKAHDRIVQVGHIERFNGAVVELFKAVRAPRFIECHRLSPYPNRGDDVSVVLDLMIHDLDIVLALDGTEVIAMDAVGVPVFSAYEDIANARIRFASGCVANLTTSRVSVDRMRKIRIFEPDAYMSTNYTEQEVRVFRKKPGPIPPGVPPMACIQIDTLPVQREEPLLRELASFVDCVRTRRRPVVSGEDGLAALRCAEQIITSIRAEQPGMTSTKME